MFGWGCPAVVVPVDDAAEGCALLRHAPLALPLFCLSQSDVSKALEVEKLAKDQILFDLVAGQKEQAKKTASAMLHMSDMNDIMTEERLDRLEEKMLRRTAKAARAAAGPSRGVFSRAPLAAPQVLVSYGDPNELTLQTSTTSEDYDFSPQRCQKSSAAKKFAKNKNRDSDEYGVPDLTKEIRAQVTDEVASAPDSSLRSACGALAAVSIAKAVASGNNKLVQQAYVVPETANVLDDFEKQRQIFDMVKKRAGLACVESSLVADDEDDGFEKFDEDDEDDEEEEEEEDDDDDDDDDNSFPWN